MGRMQIEQFVTIDYVIKYIYIYIIIIIIIII